MNLHRLLLRRAADDKPLRVALIGAGKFGSMFLAQARRTPACTSSPFPISTRSRRRSLSARVEP